MKNGFVWLKILAKWKLEVGDIILFVNNFSSYFVFGLVCFVNIYGIFVYYNSSI
jgi:hypothetical protein